MSMTIGQYSFSFLKIFLWKAYFAENCGPVPKTAGQYILGQCLCLPQIFI